MLISNHNYLHKQPNIKLLMSSNYLYLNATYLVRLCESLSIANCKHNLHTNKKSLFKKEHNILIAHTFGFINNYYSTCSVPKNCSTTSTQLNDLMYIPINYGCRDILLCAKTNKSKFVTVKLFLSHSLHG